MPFNTFKCVVLHLGGCNRKFSYHMGNTQLESVSEERDLGVIICSNLKPVRQCQHAYAKASKALGLIARTRSYKNQDILLKLHKTLVRPHLEYCISVGHHITRKTKYYLNEFNTDLHD